MKELLPLIKTKLLIVLMSIYIFLAPIHILILLVGAFIILDTIAGRWAAKRIAIKNGKNVRLAVTSKKTRKGLLGKMLSYQIAVILLFIIDDYLLHDIIKYFWSDFPVDYIITKLAGFILILIEVDSMDEKYYMVTGKRFKEIIRKKIKSTRSIISSTKEIKDEIQN